MKTCMWPVHLGSRIVEAAELMAADIMAVHRGPEIRRCGPDRCNFNSVFVPLLARCVVCTQVWECAAECPGCGYCRVLQIRCSELAGSLPTVVLVAMATGAA